MRIVNLHPIVSSSASQPARDPETDVPSPEQIRELTAEIRRHWTPQERRIRAGMFRRVELLEMRLQPRRRGFLGEWTN